MRQFYVPFLCLTACTPELYAPPETVQITGRRLFDQDSVQTRALAEDIGADALFNADKTIMGGVDDFLRHRASIDKLGQAHVKVRQMHDGVPVFGGGAIVHLNPFGHMTDLSDGWIRDIVVDTQPTTTDTQALALEVARFGGDDRVVSRHAKLTVVRHNGRDYLAWWTALDVTGPSGKRAMPNALLDAHTLQRLKTWDQLARFDHGRGQTDYLGEVTFPITRHDDESTSLLASDLHLATYDLDGQIPASKEQMRTLLTDPIRSASLTYTDEAAIDAHAGVVTSLDWLMLKAGRDHLDGLGNVNTPDGMLRAAVHLGEDYNNAYWNGEVLAFGDGDGDRYGRMTSLDIVAHELGHALTDHTADLLYITESGALNEHFSDVMGALVEDWYQPQDNRWLIAEDAATPGVVGDAMRDMSNPATTGGSDHYADRYQGGLDNGGVHINSGIPNLAFALLVDGGEHPTPWHRRRGVVPIGVDDAQAIWTAAWWHHLGWLDDLHDARQATIQSALDQFGEGSIQVESVTNAWAEVGVGEPFGGAMAWEEMPIQPTLIETSTHSGDREAPATHTFDVPQGSTGLFVTLSEGSGDADIALYRGLDTNGAKACRTYSFGNDDKCQITEDISGTWTLVLTTYGEFANVVATVEHLPQTRPPAPPVVETYPETPTPDDVEEPETPEPEAPETELHRWDSPILDADRGEVMRFTLDVPKDAQDLVFTLPVPTQGDPDLYIRRASEPTETDFDCRPWFATRDEVCAFEAAPGTWYVMVKAFTDIEGAQVSATWSQ